MRLCFLASTLFAIWIVYLAVLPIPHLDAPTLHLSGDRYFIAINFYNNEEIMADYTRELSALVDHCEFPLLYAGSSWSPNQKKLNLSSGPRECIRLDLRV
jgi:hypothetical protein